MNSCNCASPIWPLPSLINMSRWPPIEKSLPAPRMITARTVALARISRIAAEKASPISGLIAFACSGSFNVITAIVFSSRYSSCRVLVDVSIRVSWKLARLRSRLQVRTQGVQGAFVVTQTVRVAADAPVVLLEFDNRDPHAIRILRHEQFAFSAQNNFCEVEN